MAEPENVVLLREQPTESPEPTTNTEAQLRNQLLQTRKNIKKVQSSIRSKRQELLQLSNGLNKEVEKQLNDRFRQNSYNDMTKAISQYPTLAKKKIQLDSLNAQLLKLIEKNNSLRLQKQSGVSQRTDTILNILRTKTTEYEQLLSRKKSLAEYNQSLTLPAVEQTDQVMQLTHECQQLRSNTKQLHKELHSLETQQIMFNAYVSEMEYKLKQMQQVEQNREQLIDSQTFKNQLRHLDQVLSDRNQFNKKAVKDVEKIESAIEALDKQNEAILQRIKQIQNDIIKKEMHVRARHALTERAHSTSDIKKEVFNKKVLPRKTNSQRIGMLQDTSSSIQVAEQQSNKKRTIRQLTIYEDTQHFILGIQLSYGVGDQVTTGKKMMAISSQPDTETTVRMDNLQSLTISYDDTTIHNFKLHKTDSTQILVGRVNSGVSRPYNLAQETIESISAVLDTVDGSEPRLVALTIESSKKTVKKPLEDSTIPEDIQISEEAEPKSQISRIHKGSLPKLTNRQIVDHRLMLSHK